MDRSEHQFDRPFRGEPLGFERVREAQTADGHYVNTGVLPRTPKEFKGLLEWVNELQLRDEFPETVFLEMAAGRESLDRSKMAEDEEIVAMFMATGYRLGYRKRADLSAGARGVGPSLAGACLCRETIVKRPRDCGDTSLACASGTLAGNIDRDGDSAAIRRLDDPHIARSVVKRTCLMTDNRFCWHVGANATLARARSAHGAQNDLSALGGEKVALIKAL